MVSRPPVDGSGRWQVGDVVAGLYELREVITSGGMGLVYRVYHRGWNVDLAVKTPKAMSDEQAMRNFEAEARTWVELGLHPHIAACVYVRRIDGLPRVFAEWVDGGSLKQAISSRRLYAGEHPQVLARIVDLAVQLAWGIEHAHRLGVVHRDVKPANALIAADGTLKVTDFGLAKARAAAGVTSNAPASGVSVLAGFFTPAYCSPEQARAAQASAQGRPASPVGRSTDVWSWAVSVWEMFVGTAPVSYGQVAGHAFEEFRRRPWRADDRVPAMPAEMVAVLARCLNPDPQARPHNFGELARELIAAYAEILGQKYSRPAPQPAELVADGLNNHALSMLDLGQPRQAERLWQQALSVDPHDLHVVYNFGLHRWRNGTITDAELVATVEAVRISHPIPHADYLLALVHLERCDTATARTLLTAAVRDAPQDLRIAAAHEVAHRQLCLAEPRPLGGDTGWALSVAVSADGRRAVAGCSDATLRVWDLVKGTCLRTVAGHTDQVHRVAMSADGRTGVSGSHDGTARVWDLHSGECLHTLRCGKSRATSVAIAPDGSTVAYAADGVVLLWDVASGALRRTFPGDVDYVSALALSADGQIVVSGGSDGTVRLWDVVSGNHLRTLTIDPSAAYFDRPTVGSVAVSADGRIVLSTAWTAIQVWDGTTGACLRRLAGRTDYSSLVSLSIDGDIAVSGGNDETVQVWELATGSCVRTMTGRRRNTSIAVTAAGGVTLAGQGTLVVRALPTGRGRRAEWSYARAQTASELQTGAMAIESAAERVEALLVAGDGSGAAALLRTARAIPGRRRDPRLADLWRRLAALGQRGPLCDAWPFRVLTGHTGSVDCVAVTDDGRLAVSGSDDETVRVWDVSSGACIRTLTMGSLGRVSTVAVSASGDVALVVSSGTLTVWDLRTGERAHTLADAGSPTVASAAITRDGRTAISGSDTADGAVLVWDVGSGTCHRKLLGHRGEVTSVVLSADGRTATTSSNDGRAKEWDLSAGTCTRTLPRHDRELTAMTTSADGRIAVTTGGDSVRVWDLVTGAALRTLTGHHGQVRSLTMSPDAAVAISGGQDQTVRVWALDWEYEFSDPTRT